MFTLRPLQTHNLKAHRDIINHGFFTRQGGHSTGLYDSFNVSLSKGDSPQNTLKNREKIANFFEQPLANICFLKQVHGNAPLVITEPYEAISPPEADALITTIPGLVLSIQTADCVPILLYDPQGPLIAAIHGGWKGLLSGIIERTLEMIQLNSASLQTIIASIGPCIAQDSYEVDQEIFDQFQGQNSDFKSFFRKGNSKEKYQFDLQGLAQHKLRQANIQNIDLIPQDTYTNEDLLFSCRRAAHKGEKSFGNQASCIVIKK